jgi:hypothetical protein
MLIKNTFLLITILFSINYALAQSSIELENEAKYWVWRDRLISDFVVPAYSPIDDSVKFKYANSLYLCFSGTPYTLFSLNYEIGIPICKRVLFGNQLGIGFLPFLQGDPLGASFHAFISANILAVRPFYFSVGFGYMNALNKYNDNSFLCQAGCLYAGRRGLYLKLYLYQEMYVIKRFMKYHYYSTDNEYVFGLCIGYSFKN